MGVIPLVVPDSFVNDIATPQIYCCVIFFVEEVNVGEEMKDPENDEACFVIIMTGVATLAQRMIEK